MFHKGINTSFTAKRFFSGFFTSCFLFLKKENIVFNSAIISSLLIAKLAYNYSASKIESKRFTCVQRISFVTNIIVYFIRPFLLLKYENNKTSIFLLSIFMSLGNFVDILIRGYFVLFDSAKLANNLFEWVSLIYCHVDFHPLLIKQILSAFYFILILTFNHFNKHVLCFLIILLDLLIPQFRINVKRSDPECIEKEPLESNVCIPTKKKKKKVKKKKPQELLEVSTDLLPKEIKKTETKMEIGSLEYFKNTMETVCYMKEEIKESFDLFESTSCNSLMRLENLIISQIEESSSNPDRKKDIEILQTTLGDLSLFLKLAENLQKEKASLEICATSLENSIKMISMEQKDRRRRKAREVKSSLEELIDLQRSYLDKLLHESSFISQNVPKVVGKLNKIEWLKILVQE